MFFLLCFQSLQRVIKDRQSEFEALSEDFLSSVGDDNLSTQMANRYQSVLHNCEVSLLCQTCSTTGTQNSNFKNHRLDLFEFLKFLSENLIFLVIFNDSELIFTVALSLPDVLIKNIVLCKICFLDVVLIKHFNSQKLVEKKASEVTAHEEFQSNYEACFHSLNDIQKRMSEHCSQSDQDRHSIEDAQHQFQV